MSRLRDVVDVLAVIVFVVLGAIAFARGSWVGGLIYVALLGLATFNLWSHHRDRR